VDVLPRPVIGMETEIPAIAHSADQIVAPSDQLIRFTLRRCAASAIFSPLGFARFMEWYASEVGEPLQGPLLVATLK